MAIFVSTPVHLGSLNNGPPAMSWRRARRRTPSGSIPPCTREEGKLILNTSCLTFAAATPASEPEKDTGETTPMAAPEKTAAYKDNWLDLLAIRNLSTSIQATSGMWNKKKGYESLVDAAIMVSRKYDTKEQQQVAFKSIHKAFPVHFLLIMIKNLLPESKFLRELCAAFSKFAFTWLVGPCEVRTTEAEGKIEKNVVYIPKCRFLESTKCVGICTNMCKIPTQKFIHESLGMPVYMVPNFEDMSCEIIFGKHPPVDDPALKHTCYHKLCIVKQKNEMNCSS